MRSANVSAGDFLFRDYLRVMSYFVIDGYSSNCLSRGVKSWPALVWFTIFVHGYSRTADAYSNGAAYR
ncbi:hypothetical protein BURKHO8Y_110084 [Burkholderia sp. 8Y]|nr:hypothetical protein BURKHO8Y_110084 [Burkholderia sp. 8Y]